MLHLPAGVLRGEARGDRVIGPRGDLPVRIQFHVAQVGQAQPSQRDPGRESARCMDPAIHNLGPGNLVPSDAEPLVIGQKRIAEPARTIVQEKPDHGAEFLKPARERNESHTRPEPIDNLMTPREVAKQMLRLILFLVLCVLVVGPDRSAPSPAPRPAPAKVEVDFCRELPSAEQFLTLAKDDPLLCLQAVIARSQREYRGYTTTMVKRERIGSRLNPEETVEATYRADPHSVLLDWKTNPAGQADRVLYVQGANADQMLVRPKSALARAVAGAVVTVDPDGKEARAGGRVSVREFGMQKATERLLAAWTAAKANGELHVHCLGVKPIPELDGRPCLLLERILHEPDAEKLHKVLVGLDAETWQQVMTITTDTQGQVIASYHFKNVVLNPEFAPDAFDRSALK